MGKIIAQGAEAVISLNKNTILKNRISKSYRLKELDDKLRKIRTKKEVRLLEKALNLIPVPKIIKINSTEIELEYLKGKKLASYLNIAKDKTKIAKLIGENIAILHDNNIIHGDLTTSNMIYTQDLQSKSNLKKSKVYFIDFGLGFESKRAEDKATDLHVLKEALEAKHYKHAKQIWKSLISSYKKYSTNSSTTLKQLSKVESRGRYKAQY